MLRLAPKTMKIDVQRATDLRDASGARRSKRSSRTMAEPFTAKGNRWGHRDATMILAAFRHGLRASELTDLRWDQVEFDRATLHVCPYRL